MKREAMKKQARRLLGYVKEEDFESLLWCLRQYAAEGMNEEARKERELQTA